MIVMQVDILAMLVIGFILKIRNNPATLAGLNKNFFAYLLKVKRDAKWGLGRCTLHSVWSKQLLAS